MTLSSSEKNRLKDRYGSWAVVTGASSGIGRELAVRLAQAGLHVVLTGRNETALKALSNDIAHQFQVATWVVKADLAQEEGVTALIEATRDLEVGLFIGAAGYGTSGEFVRASLEAERNMLQVNCGAVLSLTHHFVQRFKAQGRGGIILLGSIVGFQGVPYAAHYAATKAYVQSLAEALALELKPYGIDVLSAAPAPVNSGFAARANMKLGKALEPEDIGVPILKALGRKTTVLPGFLTKFLVGSLRMLPRWGKIRVMKLVMGGMTRHQRELSTT